MKKMKKLAALFLAVVMAMAMGMTALAAEGDGPSITIENSAKGTDNYKVYKIFDATRNENGHMAYKLMQGKTAPAGFTADANGYITNAPANLNETQVSALIDYVGLRWNDTTKKYEAKEEATVTPVATISGNGGTVTKELGEYGYYLVVSDKGAVVSIDNNAPGAVIVDKNASKPVVDPEKAKTVNHKDVYIGQEIDYTLTFGTVNYVTEEKEIEEGMAPTPDDVTTKQVKKYIITDTLPAGVTFKEITSIKVNGTSVENAPKAFTNGKIEIPWTDANGNSIYADKAELVVEYKVTVNENIELGEADENKNTVSLSWEYADGTTDGGDGYTADVTISTYAIVLQKVDENGHNLAGAKFKITGYEVAGTPGMYKITGKTTEENAQSTVEMECDGTGKLVIYGLAKTGKDNTTNEKYTITETTAPTGYNILEAPKMVEATKVATTVTTTAYDKDGNVTEEESKTVYTESTGDNITLKIENLRGVVLPSTGGIGTTIFYVVGGILVLGAAVLLITKKRMSARN